MVMNYVYFFFWVRGVWPVLSLGQWRGARSAWKNMGERERERERDSEREREIDSERERERDGERERERERGGKGNHGHVRPYMWGPSPRHMAPGTTAG